MRIVNRRAVHTPTPTVTIQVNGQAVPAVPGSSLSGALWNAGWRAFSAHPVTGRPRGPLCGMGTCHECLVWVSEAAESIVPGELGDADEAQPGNSRIVRSCLEPVRAGLCVGLNLPAEKGGATS